MAFDAGRDRRRLADGHPGRLQQRAGADLGAADDGRGHQPVDRDLGSGRNGLGPRPARAAERQGGAGALVGLAPPAPPLPRGKAEQAPWWAWLGGACGAIALLSQPLAAPRLGAAIYIGLFVTASSIASVLADHFGWLGFDQHPAGLGRIAGCAL